MESSFDLDSPLLPEKPSYLVPAPPQWTATVGRPSTYNKEIGDRICIEISMNATKPNRKICSELGVPYSTFKQWLRDIPEFAAQYTRAKEDQADEIIEEMVAVTEQTVEFGDMAGAAMKKLKVDTLKFIATKLRPKVYGDVKDVKVEITQPKNLDPQQFQEMMATLVSLPKQIEHDKNAGIEDAEEVS